MSGDCVLIAAYSGRALAQSARRAGYVPLVVDCFGDEDTAAAAAAIRVVPAMLGAGLAPRALLAALDELVAAAPGPVTGLVVGSGLEHSHRLMQRLAGRFTLTGNTPESIERVKSPESFFGTLRRLGIAHPETTQHPPDQGNGQLMKRIGGSGGLHIRDCPYPPQAKPRWYFQRKFNGQAISVLGVLSLTSTAFAFSEQWTSPAPRARYRYGGAVGSITVEPDVEGRMLDAALDVAREFGLLGLVSFDFLVHEGEPHLLEVNARPGATLDIFDDERGTLFAAHLAACTSGGDPAALMAQQWRPAVARACAILYGDRGSLTVPPISWPEWVADRPRVGSRIGKHQPIATVIADGSTPEEAKTICLARLGQLDGMLYENPQGKVTNVC